MSGDIGIPFVLQLKDVSLINCYYSSFYISIIRFQGVNAMHLTDFEGIAQSIENAHLYQYVTNGNPSLELTDHPMYIQPLTHVLDGNVQIIDNAVQIVDETEQNLGSTQQIVDHSIQVIETNGTVLNNKRQGVDNEVQVTSSSCHILNKLPIVDSNVRIVTSNGQLLRNEGQIMKNIQIADNSIKILNSNGQLIDKNVQIADSNMENSIKMETDLNEMETKGVVNFIYEVVYPEQLNLKVCLIFDNNLEYFKLNTNDSF